MSFIGVVKDSDTKDKKKKKTFYKIKRPILKNVHNSIDKTNLLEQTCIKFVEEKSVREKNKLIKKVRKQSQKVMFTLFSYL